MDINCEKCEELLQELTACVESFREACDKLEAIKEVLDS